MSRWIAKNALLATLGLALAISFCGDCQADESIADELLLHDVRLHAEVRGATARMPLLLITEIHGNSDEKLMRTDLLARLVRLRLQRSGIAVRSYPGSFRSEFASKRLGPTALLSPKLVVEIGLRRDAENGGYSSACEMTLVEYPNGGGTTEVRHPVKRWASRQDIKGIGRTEIEDTVIQYVEKELEGFLSQDVADKFRAAKPLMRAEGGLSGNGKAAYSLTLNDPERKRHQVTVGFTAGTPALANLHLGFWGGRRFPFIVALSGMYFGLERRGVQLEVAWAFDNMGNFRQAIGLALVAINETTVAETPQVDSVGRVLQVTRDTYNDLRPYLGPSYTVDWNHFRVQVGGGYKLNSANQSTIRAFGQLGYAMPVGF